MLEKLLAAEILEIGVLDPAIAQALVRHVVHVLEDRQPGHQPRRQRRSPRLVFMDLAEAALEKTPVDLPRQPHQRMPHVDDLVEPRPEHVPLARLASFGRLHSRPQHRRQAQ